MLRPSGRVALSSILLFLGVLCAANIDLRSGDAYVRSVGTQWTLGTSLVKKTIALRSGRVQSGVSDEIQLSGAPWSFVHANVRKLEQGELQFDLAVKGGSFEVTKHYVLYPGTGLIREWLTIRNASSSTVHLTAPYFLNAKVDLPKASQPELDYITGAGNYNGSQLLKIEKITPAYNRTFDSHGFVQPESYSSYLPLIVIRGSKNGTGMAVGWDYLGHWTAKVEHRSGDSVGVSLQVAGYDKQLAPGDQIETPKAFTETFAGDLDTLGNLLLDWQYQYLWDYTNPDYFAKTRWAVDWPSPWMPDGGTPSADNWGRRLALDMRYIDLMRETGGDILWDDAGWYDKWGSWAAPDWRRTTDYLKKYGMRWVLWYPTFLATPESVVAQRHPDWLIPRRPVLEQSIPATADWQKQLLDRSVQEWGDYQWRYDIAPAVSANDTDYLQSDQNFRDLIRRFKRAHPASGVDACYGGGRWISYGIARLAESGEYTDGGVGPYSAYYTSLIVPPDKLHNVTDFDHTYYNAASDRTHLSMDPTWYRDPGDGPNLEAIRKDWEIYHYLASQGVTGRWSHVFRPRVENDDAIWYFQRMNRDGAKGVILTKHAKTGPEYYLVSKPSSSASKDQYRGSPWEMNVVSTTSAASMDTGIYEDPADGGYGFYGVSGETYGPVNFRYQAGSDNRSYITAIEKVGGSEKVGKKFFGMAFQTGEEPLTITELGQYDPGANRGTYTLMLVRASDKKVIAEMQLDMSHAHSDRLGFKYAKLSSPIRLERGDEKSIAIFPRGLQPELTYDLRTYKSGLRIKQTGSQLMSQGISLKSIQPGELIFLNLPEYPGSGEDKVPPEAPKQVTKRAGANLDVAGIEIAWSPGKDDNWLSYYEVLKNGIVIGKSAKGTFYFDHNGHTRFDINAQYEVRSVDGDGNRSSLVEAHEIAGDPETYEAFGGFSATQGANQWVYEETFDGDRYHDLTWDSGGYEGRWTGSGLGRIGRIWMEPSASADLSRTFVSPSDGVLMLSGSIRKDPSAQNGAAVQVRIILNDRQIWPANGCSIIPPEFSKEVNYRLDRVQVVKGDKVRFIIRRNETNRMDPVMWNPVIVIEKGNP